jgi:hypothetical protein
MQLSQILVPEENSKLEYMKPNEVAQDMAEHEHNNTHKSGEASNSSLMFVCLFCFP